MSHDKLGEICPACGKRPNPSFPPRRREVAPETKELARQEKREGRPLAETLSETTVVPAVLSMVQDTEVVLGHELKLLRLKAQDPHSPPLDFKETKRMEMLVNMLDKIATRREKSERQVQEPMRNITTESLVEKLLGKKK